MHCRDAASIDIDPALFVHPSYVCFRQRGGCRQSPQSWLRLYRTTFSSMRGLTIHMAQNVWAWPLVGHTAARARYTYFFA